MQTNSVQTLIQKAILSIALLLFISSSSIHAQENTMPQDIFFEVACFKAKGPGMQQMFIEMGKPFHEEMIKQGLLLDWAFFRVDYPNGKDCDCDYREIRVFKGLAALDKLNSEGTGMAIAKKVFPEMDLQAAMEKFREMAEFRNSQIFRLAGELVPGPVETKMAVVNFMDVAPGMNEEYLTMEEEVFKPIHKANQEAGNVKDWIIAEAIFPYGTEYPIDYITVDAYDSYQQMSNAQSANLFKKVHPDKDPEATWKKMAETRDLTKAEIWVKVTEADHPKPEEATTTKKK